jgi:hypothetical protein
MSRDQRKEVITEIETLRGSRVLSYVTGDRAPTPAQIGDDAVRPIYDQLRMMGHVKRLDVFLYSRGGAIDAPFGALPRPGKSQNQNRLIWNIARS